MQKRCIPISIECKNRKLINILQTNITSNLFQILLSLFLLCTWIANICRYQSLRMMGHLGIVNLFITFKIRKMYFFVYLSKQGEKVVFQILVAIKIVSATSRKKWQLQMTFYFNYMHLSFWKKMNWILIVLVPLDKNFLCQILKYYI